LNTAGSFDATIKLWDTKSNSSKPLMSIADAKDSVSCLAVVGTEIYAGSVDGRVRIYDIRMGRVNVDVIGRKSRLLIQLLEYSNRIVSDPVTSVTPTRRNDAYLVSTLDSALRLIDKTSGKLLQAFRSPEVG
jgi:mitogen-activated protein kinase organizer 1